MGAVRKITWVDIRVMCADGVPKGMADQEGTMLMDRRFWIFGVADLGNIGHRSNKFLQALTAWRKMIYQVVCQTQLLCTRFAWKGSSIAMCSH